MTLLHPITNSLHSNNFQINTTDTQFIEKPENLTSNCGENCVKTITTIFLLILNLLLVSDQYFLKLYLNSQEQPEA